MYRSGPLTCNDDAADRYLSASKPKKSTREIVVKDFLAMNKNMDNVRRNSPYHSGTSQYVPPSKNKDAVVYKKIISPVRRSPEQRKPKPNIIFSPVQLPPEPEENRRKPFVPQINNSQSHLLSPSRSSAKSPIRGVSPSRQATNRPVTINSPMRSSQQEYTYELSAPADLGLSRSISQSQYRSPSKRGKNSIINVSIRSPSNSRVAAYNEIQRLTFSPMSTSTRCRSEMDRDILSDNRDAVSTITRKPTTIKAPMRSEHYLLPSRRKYQQNYTLNLK
ncbi:Hypothetical protein GLP15_482 [Giardia lamblia P15]|uniref:Uncharacterized protein n=1 Tax=Giardia intestinalis (strain P15) TaxID=658858 RepID=E1F6G6_GIAIA|nr:Hypothetical protein GLP15_482 [Giardia lamblia P15]